MNGIPSNIFCTIVPKRAQISPMQYFLGVRPSCSNSKVINALTLNFKFYIYRQKLFHNCELNILSLLAEVKTKIRTEKLICAIQNKNLHFDKWKNVLLSLG